MTNQELILNNINKINKLAKERKKTPQKLMKKLDADITALSQDGYSMTLVEATEDESIKIYKGATILANSNNMTPWTRLVDTTVDKYVLSKAALRKLDNETPPFQRFSVCETIPKRQKRNGDRVFKHIFRPLTFNDINDLIKRFYSVKKKLESEDDMGEEMDIYSVVKKLRHLNRIAQHGFIKEALDEIFNGTRYYSNEVKFPTRLSMLAAIASNRKPFHIYKNGNRAYLCNTKHLIMAYKKNKIFKSVNDFTKADIQKLEKLKNKYKFITLILDIGQNMKNAYPVKKIDMRRIINKTITAIKKDSQKAEEEQD